jgi:diaminohydroxyphosphoribosylaminopyrimidine deaminase/5-amino-6-(5-phosphoribosylamino)uracil reductase
MRMSATDNRDKKFIKRSFTLAKRGSGKVSPNPLVGAVLVKNGKVTGEGYHKKYGTAHAEVNAIKNAGKSAAGATLYCNLEPCCHTGKQTPPCVPLIIKRNIKRVAISNIDPNREVNGEGVKQLRKAGVEVTTGIMKEEGAELNKFYFKFVKKKLPYVTLKIAQSADGKISKSVNRQTWLTGKLAKRFVHKLRSEYDAVLVGANTIKVDNPFLTVREVKGRNPVRIILDGKLSIPLNSKILKTEKPQKTWIFTSSRVSKRKFAQLKNSGIEIFQISKAPAGRLNLKKILSVLAKHKITSLLVEGGADIFSQFIKADLFDEVIILQAPKILERGVSIRGIDKIRKLKIISSSKLGADTRFIYRKNFPD